MAVLLVLCCQLARAEGLRLERRLVPPRDAQSDVPVYVFGDRIDSVGDEEIEIIGHAELRKGALRLSANRIRYSPRSDEAEASGNVRLHSPSGDLAGPRARLRIDDQAGILNMPAFSMAPRPPPPGAPLVIPTETRGVAQNIRFAGNDRYRVSDGTFTTCKPGDDDWFLHAENMDLDYIGNVGEAQGVQLNFLGVSTPALPYANFPLNDVRKSGFLPPTIGLQGSVGALVAMPYYFNLAPNYDDTFTPKVTTKRGLMLDDEFRFITPGGSGVVDAEYLPYDPLYQGSRYALHTIDTMRWGNITASLNIDKVSDNNYFRDLSTSLPLATQQYLNQSGSVGIQFAPGWNLSMGLQHTQILADPTSSVPPPPVYDSLPSLALTAYRPGILGSEFTLNSSFVRFIEPNAPVGDRLVVNPALTFPFVTPGLYIKPKIGLHYTEYDLSNLSTSTDPSVQAGSAHPTRLLPIASVDSGMVFERPLNWQSTDLINTLEPRLFYVYIPYRNQSGIPVFDSGIPDLSYASLFTENYYTGSDRISDANQLTTAVSSRLIRADNGQEIVRGFVGERLYFTSQQVTLGPSYPARTEGSTSLIAGVSGQVLSKVTVEATDEFNPIHGGTDLLNTGVRYQPEIGKVLNLDYRYISYALNSVPNPLNGQPINQALKEADVSGQWPIHRNLYAVGRYSYSLQDRRPTETTLGFEYNGGCWIVRMVAQSFVTGVSSQTHLFFLQLELNGFSRVGSNPLDVLRRSVAGYTPLNQRNVELRQLDLYGN